MAAGTVAGIAIISVASALKPALEAWVKQDLHHRLRLLAAALTLLTAGPTVGVGSYVWRFGRCVIRAGRFPPPRARLIRDTPVVVGDAAVWRGRVLQACGAALALAGLLLSIVLWRVLGRA